MVRAGAVAISAGFVLLGCVHFDETGADLCRSPKISKTYEERQACLERAHDYEQSVVKKPVGPGAHVLEEDCLQAGSGPLLYYRKCKDVFIVKTQIECRLNVGSNFDMRAPLKNKPVRWAVVDAVSLKIIEVGDGRTDSDGRMFITLKKSEMRSGMHAFEIKAGDFVQRYGVDALGGPLTLPEKACAHGA